MPGAGRKKTSRSDRRMQHSISIPNHVWEYAQRMSGLTNPASWIRELIYEGMVRTSEASDGQLKIEESITPVDIKRKQLDARWASYNMAHDNFDTDFNEAKDAFIRSFQTEDDAIRWIDESVKHRGLRSPRSWLMSVWWRNSRAE